MPDQEDLLLKSAKVSQPLGKSIAQPKKNIQPVQNDLLIASATGGGSKKKDSSDGSGDAGAPEVSISSSETTELVSGAQSRLGAKTFLDEDINTNIDIAINVTKSKGPLGAFAPGGALRPTMNTGAEPTPINSQVIKADPENLKKYYSSRAAVLDEKIQQTNAAALEASKQYLGEKVLYKETPQSVALKSESDALQKYKNNLRKAVKEQAAISITQNTLAKGEKPDPQKIGKELYNVIGDPTLKSDDKVLAELATPSSTVFLNPHGDAQAYKQLYDVKAADKARQNIEYKRYTAGAQAIQDYWQHKSDELAAKNSGKIAELESLYKNKSLTPDQKLRYDELVKDKDVRDFFNAQDKLQESYATVTGAIKKFPQVERMKERQKVNDAFFAIEDAKSTSVYTPSVSGVLKFLFGATPSKKDIPQLAKISGVSEDKVAAMLDEGGFFKDIPYSVRINGLLQGVASGAGETFKKMGMGVRRFLNQESAITETENRLQQNELDEFNLKAEANKLRDDTGKWHFNPSSIANTMGFGMGQTTVQALPALMTGGLAAEGSILSKGIEAINTVIPGAAASYEDAWKFASENTSDVPTIKAYALLNSLANGAAEMLYSPADIVKSVSGGMGQKQIFKAFMKDVAENGLEKTVTSKLAELGKKIWAVGKEPGNILLSENIEEQATNLATNALDDQMLGIRRTQAQLADQSFETFVQTTLQTLPLAIGAGINGNHDQSGVRKQSLFEVGKEPDLYHARLQDLLDKEVITPDQFNEKVSVINTMSKVVSQLPKKNALGKPLSYDESVELAAQEFRILNNKQKEKNGVLEAEKPLIEADNAEAIQRQTEILNPLETQQNETSAKEKNTGEESNTSKESTGQVGGQGPESQEASEVSVNKFTPEQEELVMGFVTENHDKVQGVLDRINKGEPVNENEILDAADTLDKLSKGTKNDSLTNLINPLVDKLLGYENQTKTQTRTVTEKEAVKVARAPGSQRTASKSLEQWEGSRARLVGVDGKVSEGVLKSEDGKYVIFDADGNKIAALGEKNITDRDVSLPSKEEVPSPITVDKEGNVKSITLQLNKVDKEKGGVTKSGLITLDFKDPDKALDYAIQLRGEEIGDVSDPDFETAYQEVTKEITEEVPVNNNSKTKTETDEKVLQTTGSSETSSEQPSVQKSKSADKNEVDSQTSKTKKDESTDEKGRKENGQESGSQNSKGQDGQKADEGSQHVSKTGVANTPVTPVASSLNENETENEIQQPAENKKPQPEKVTQDQQRPTETEAEKDPIAEYDMTNSTEIEKFLSGDTMEDVFGDIPEGDQGYYVQKLTDMLKDGKNMIGLAQAEWGDDIADYGRPLFQYIQSMSNDKQLTNKKAVLLATFLGEIKEEVNKNPERKDEIRPLQNAVESYYQTYMNMLGKSVVAGRLLRLYRDKYFGDVFINRILEQNQIKAKESLKKIEDGAKIIDEIAEASVTITAEEKRQEDKAQSEKIKADKKATEKKKKMGDKEAAQLAASKLEEIKNKSGDVKSFAQEIKDRIDKLNCK